MIDSATGVGAPFHVKRVLDLFSGIGGFSYGLELAGGYETVAFCESDPYCQQVLAKLWPGVPIYDDITTLAYADGECRPGYRGLWGTVCHLDGYGAATEQKRHELEHGLDCFGEIDLICGGFPCQPFSQAGKRGGAADHRALWPEMFRLVREVQPAWVIGENVAGIINMELDTVLSDLEGEGYACQTFVIPACGVDAPHRRDRVWIVGHADGDSESVGAVDAEASRNTTLERVAQYDGRIVYRKKRTGIHPGRELLEGRQGRAAQSPAEWLLEPRVGRVANGIPRRVDRLRALGNAVVPQVVALLGAAINQWEEEKCRSNK